jgi:hypothetical protein
MISEHIDREEALRVFSRRFSGLSEKEVAERFDGLLELGLLDFSRSPDGALRVSLAGRKAQQ